MADADANEEMFGFEFWSIVGSNIIFLIIYTLINLICCMYELLQIFILFFCILSGTVPDQQQSFENHRKVQTFLKTHFLKLCPMILKLR